MRLNIKLFTFFTRSQCPMHNMPITIPLALIFDRTQFESGFYYCIIIAFVRILRVYLHLKFEVCKRPIFSSWAFFNWKIKGTFFPRVNWYLNILSFNQKSNRIEWMLSGFFFVFQNPNHNRCISINKRICFKWLRNAEHVRF